MIEGDKIDRMLTQILAEADIEDDACMSAWSEEHPFLSVADKEGRSCILSYSMDKVMITAGVAEEWIKQLDPYVNNFMTNALLCIHTTYLARSNHMTPERQEQVVNFIYEIIIMINDRFWIMAKLRSMPMDEEDMHDSLCNLMAFRRALRSLLIVLDPADFVPETF